MTKLDHITIRGFKSIAAIEKLPIAPINVLIGANGSGKSNFLGAFAFLRELRCGRLREYVARAGGADNILHFGSKTTSELQFGASFGGGATEYEIALLATQGDRLELGTELLKHRPDNSMPAQCINLAKSSYMGEAGIAERNGTEAVKRVQSQLDDWALYRFNDSGRASPMKKTARISDNIRLYAEADNLAAYLYLLQQKHNGRFLFIEKVIRLAVPFMRRFILQPEALNEEMIRLKWQHTADDSVFDVSAFSDGTLRFIALATLLMQPDTMLPSLILLDEPESGLHPLALSKFAAMVRSAAARGTQVILATQSSILLDYFSPADVLVAERDKGQTELKRLNADELQVWEDDYSLGQLWEKNYLGGRPCPER